MSWLSNFFRNFKLTSDGNWNVGRSTALPGASKSGIFSGFGGISQLVDALVARLAGNELTGAEREANEFSAGEAQKSRDFTEYMTRNKYQMETQSMEQAGINPAMVYGGGQLVPTATNGAQANSVAPQSGALFDLLPTLMRMPAEIEELRAAAQQHRDEGTASLMNANSAARQAGAAERQAGVAERNASVNELRVQFEQALADSQIEVNGAQAHYMAKMAQKAQKEFEQMDEYLSIAQQNADANSMSSLAALQSALAAQQNAATNEYLSGYQAAMFKGQAMLSWAQGEGQSIINQRLDEKTKAEVELLQKQGVKVDKEGNLIDKEGKKVTAEIVGIYTHAVAEVSEQANNWVGSFVPNIGRTVVKGLK